MINAKVKINLSFPKITTQKNLEEIAKKVIIPDIGDRINKGQDINGNTYRHLDPKTIEYKRKKGLRTKPLIATGQLRRSPKFKSKGTDTVIIYPAGNRRDTHLSNADIGNILQNEGVRTKYGKRFFEFFGISDKAEGKAVKYMVKLIDEAVKRGERKIVR